MESLESSEFYPNQEVLLPSKPLYEQGDQFSFQLTGNLKGNEHQRRETVALRIPSESLMNGPKNKGVEGRA